MGTPLTRNAVLIGAKLGPYEIVRFIGQGGTASVFEGRHLALGKPVAVKIIHEHLAGDASFAGRFLREGKLAAQLRHPHSIDILDVGEERGVPYLVMELLEGTTLHARLAEQRLLELDEALRIFFPMAAALAHAHTLGIIHRDIKPANIFLARDARGTLIPKLVDFGLSKLADGAEGATLTATDVVMGTVAYMAPEQTMGGKFATAKSDQYSLAAVLYECIAGRSPFTADGFYELLEAVRTSQIKPPSLVNSRLSETIDDVVMRALNRDALKRHPSVRGFASELLPFAPSALAETWRSDFQHRTTSSASMVAAASPPPSSKTRPVAGSVHEAAHARPSEPRHPSVGMLRVPREVVIAEKKVVQKPTEWHVPFPRPREQIADAKHFRSTWLTASQATLRERGLGAEYEAALDPKHRAAVLSAVAGVWLPMDVARAHYSACDHLGLTDAELVEIGRAAMRRANATALSFMTRLAQGAGVTPWTVLAQTPRLWAQTCDDGVIAVARLGPKEARLEVLGYPLAELRYNRITFRGITIGCVELFCQKAYVKELSPLCDRRTITLRLSWV